MSENSKFHPFVPASSNMLEFSLRSVVLGVLMAMVMSAANAYLGLKAGMTIAATYTAAVIGMTVLKIFKGTILEENTSRTIGSIGGNIASGAIFTLPAFFVSGIWPEFFSVKHYLIATVILASAGVLGVMFVSLIRRVMVEDADLPFPESIAAAEIHKSAREGSGGSKFLLAGIGLGAFFTALVEFKFIALGWKKVVSFTKGAILFESPGMSTAYLGVGYIIGPKLGAINFSGGVLAWGLMAPIIAYFINYSNPDVVPDWGVEIARVWKAYVRYIAIGGMLVGAFYTLFMMRKSLMTGISRAFMNVTRASQGQAFERTDRDINIRFIMLVIGLVAFIMFFIFSYFTGSMVAAIVATLVMIILGFVFAAVSGYLVGIIGVSSNPTSGLTVSVVIVAAFLMISLGMKGEAGIAAVLGIAAFTAVSVSVAGEALQDLKAGHILGCTPWKMQLGDTFGIVASASTMFLVLSLLHLGDIKQAVTKKIDDLNKSNIQTVVYEGKNPSLAGKTFTIAEIKAMKPELQNEVLQTNAGFGGQKIPAPQASLMAIVARSIVEAKTEWILILAGMFMGLGFILMQVKSPMLISVGMYLPIDTSFSIFIGGLIKAVADWFVAKRNLSEVEKEKIFNKGTLLASGLIAGEALIGLLFAGLAFGEVKLFHAFDQPSFLYSIFAIVLIGYLLVKIPLSGGKK